MIEQVGREVRKASIATAASCDLDLNDRVKVASTRRYTNNNTQLESVSQDDETSYAKAMKSTATLKQDNGFSSCEEEDTDRYEATHSEGKSKPDRKARLTRNIFDGRVMDIARGEKKYPFSYNDQKEKEGERE